MSATSKPKMLNPEMDLENVIKRLQNEAQEDNDNDEFHKGLECGDRWLRLKATFRQIRKIDDFYTGHNMHKCSRNSRKQLAAVLVQVVPMDNAWTWCNNLEPSDEFVCGFIEGAMGVWRIIKDKV